ncbi:nucleotidyltransferase domain-containing protein [Phenylobacterium sp.]|uniref:nucleotidyltransferase domain-containing protein n=1 Tax=Phenylobacterium sp. TaxID=1871053 RepID=UPI0030F3F6C9
MRDHPAERPRYFDLLELAETSSDVLAFWLTGSRGKGRETQDSDFDCVLVVEDEVFEDWCARHAGRERGRTDCSVMTLEGLRAHAAWGGPDTWDRYSYAHIRVLADRTDGLCQRLIDEKARVPASEVAGFIDRSLDHYLNQTYRALKCLRDGLPMAARLEAVDGITPLMDAIFALNGGRLRPFYKYLDWEMASHPLAAGQDLAVRTLTLLDPDAEALRSLLRDAEPLFRAAGHGAVFEGWGGDLAWMRG